MAFKMKNPSVAKMVKMAGNNKTAMKMKAEEAAAMKMKKAAMKLKEAAAMKLSEEDKKKAMDNAMPAAEKVSMSKETMASAKKYGFMDGGSFNQDKAKGELRRLSNMTGQTDSNRAKQAEIRKLMKAFS
jgi:hypothetical protein